jgi:hypothetical protein
MGSYNAPGAPNQFKGAVSSFLYITALFVRLYPEGQR